MPDITIHTDGHINPYEDALKTHVPAIGDVYAVKRPSCNGYEIVRLTGRGPNGNWRCEDALTGESYRDIAESYLKEYYRWIRGDIDEVSSLARMITEGKAAEAAALIGAGAEAAPADTESLMATETPEHITALLDASERIQSRLEEARLVASCIIEKRKAELDDALRDMKGYVNKMQEKVNNILKVITVLNLYTGATVDIHRITEGDPAPKDEPLSLRQRILFMDEELCVHLDHEADYRDVPAFFEWMKEPANRDIIVPERRCAVCLKPKRFDMNYRSGDPVYDARRNTWNKHTYVVIRNGDNLWWFESEDLEVWEWAFPHEDFEEKFKERLANERYWKDHAVKEHDAVTYRVTKYMMFLQGLLDQRPDLTGPVTHRPNLMKLHGVRLIRDDENLLGTGRKPCREFREEKNALIRRGTRILYVAGSCWSDSYKRRPTPSSGQFVKYFTNDWSMPEFPGTGLYSSDEIETVYHYEKGIPVKAKHPKPVFLYLPGDKVWDRTEYEERERKNRVSWEYNPDYVLNYDAVSLDELQEYLEDRTMRNEFASMIPTLVTMKLHKLNEMKEEAAFRDLLSEDIRRETGILPDPDTIDEAITWWKSRVIFTRALRSDDRKAWKMIRQRVLKRNKP